MRTITDSQHVATATRGRTALVTARSLAIALAVPLLVTLLTATPFAVAPALDGDDHALLWIAGDATATDAAATAIGGHDVFRGGATRDGTPPPGCPANALRLHLDVARTDEAAVARTVLEQAAHDAGASVCGDVAFEIAHPGHVAAWGPLALSIVVPAALLLAVRGRVATPATAPGEGRRATHACPPSLRGASAACAAIAVLVMPLPGGIASTGPLLPAGLVLATLPAAVHEAAFRGWLLSHAARVLPASGAALLSVGASVAAAGLVAMDVPLPATFAIAAATSGVYLRTRSLALCIAVHVLAAALWRGLAA